MFVPYTVDVPMARMPISNWVLMAVTFFISIGVWVKDSHRARLGQRGLQLPRHLERKQDQLLNDPRTTDEDWDRFHDEVAAALESAGDGPSGALDPRNFSIFQVISYQFVHGDILHLAGNLLFLFVFGNAVNAKLGQVLFIAAYLLLGALAGLGWLMFGNGLPLIGASGAIMGIVGIFFVYFPRNEVSVFYYWWRTGGGEFQIPAFWVILAYMILDLVGALRAHQGIAYVCHLTGALFGIAFAVSLLTSRIVRSTKYEENLLQVLGLSRKGKGRSLRHI